MLKNLDYIIIDEVSMMPEMFYSLFVMMKRTFSKIKFILVGDFGQLPPVNDIWGDDKDYENSGGMYSFMRW